MKVAIQACARLRQNELTIPVHLERELRRADDFIKLAAITSTTCLDQHPNLDGSTTGIYLGTAFGPMATNLDVLNDLVHDEPLSPTLFSHSVFNAACGYLARLHGIHGPTLTMTSFAWPFFCALQAAWQALRAGDIEHALVVQVETYAPLLADGRNALSPVPLGPWPAGAVACLLGHQGGCRLEAVRVTPTPCPAADLLRRQEGGCRHENRHPLAAAEQLCSLVDSGTAPEQWQIKAAYGEVDLIFSNGER